ncbi:MAG: hypothetical protein DI536_01735 [Archangium gephyra]|uniref:Peptidase M50 domain-containing protein n=1 Tax=Archangium gephyra TaxID=48 RepID=A0A2W5U312_9BACT|nr:MAG: hypothetical protein DI536_01735 [Archangium gephyra]
MWVAQLGAILLTLVALYLSGIAVGAALLGAKPTRLHLGLTPTLFGHTFGKLRVELGLLPFGGYVQFGEAGETFEALSPARRLLIIFAGPVTLIIVALLLGDSEAQFPGTFVKLFEAALHPATEGARLAQRLITLVDQAPLQAMNRLAFAFAAFNLLPLPPLAGSQALEALTAGRKVTLPSWTRALGAIVMLTVSGSWLYAMISRR